MRKVKEIPSKESKTAIRPALSPEAEEQQMVYLATNLAKKQLMDGTASSQVITHYLKLGSQREKIEREILEKQGRLLDAKADAVQSTEKLGRLYEDALKAFKTYSGQGGSEDEY